ncbi:hypothetical protein EBB07_30925 [Paenibacillaceae bacterium]|nr:hypothetical protein EBB07_30925 [Paenibacillaceae bacterium]
MLHGKNRSHPIHIVKMVMAHLQVGFLLLEHAKNVPDKIVFCFQGAMRFYPSTYHFNFQSKSDPHKYKNLQDETEEFIL